MTPSSTAPTAPATAPALERALERALEVDHRAGTGTALLLVQVDGPLDGQVAGVLERRMRSALRAGDRWLRTPCGLLAVLLTGLRAGLAEAAVERAADALLHAVECWPPGGELRVNVGASLTPWRATTSREAFHGASAALEAARAAGGGCARISAT